jgi:HK97 family phage prohead protease
VTTQLLKNIEKRVFHIELRADDADAERRTVTGYAAVFNSPSEDMGFIEYIEPGAFRDALKTSDVRALFNHDPNYILARTASGTLRLEEDGKGLRYQFDAPATTFGNDFLTMLRRGDISQSSFGFTVGEQAWEEKRAADGSTQHIRRIKKIDRLFDVSPVTYPAYPDTEVALRAMSGDMGSKGSAPDVDAAVKSLAAAIDRHKRHMDGSEPTDEASQMQMMMEMQAAHRALTGEERDLAPAESHSDQAVNTRNQERERAHRQREMRLKIAKARLLGR